MNSLLFSSFFEKASRKAEVDCSVSGFHGFLIGGGCFLGVFQSGAYVDSVGGLLYFEFLCR